MADVSAVNGGSVWLLTPHSRAARAWVEEHIGEGNGYQPYWPTVTVEARYVGDIINGLQDAGLKVVESSLSKEGRNFLTA